MSVMSATSEINFYFLQEINANMACYSAKTAIKWRPENRHYSFMWIKPKNSAIIFYGKRKNPEHNKQEEIQIR